MQFRRTISPGIRAAVLIAAFMLAGLALAAAPSGKPTPSWHLSGDLAEACTCSVPCTCNFGADPSPHHYCYAVFSLDIEKGHYGSVRLDGLHFAAGAAAKGYLWFIDERATKEQAAALQAIGNAMHDRLVDYWRAIDPKLLEDPQFNSLGFKTVKITQEAGPTKSLLKIGDFGGFDSDYIIGLDGKTPVLVENNWSWNIQHGIKGKTGTFKYKDEFGNEIDTSATNANQGKFDWSDKTAIYFR